MRIYPTTLPMLLSLGFAQAILASPPTKVPGFGPELDAILEDPERLYAAHVAFELSLWDVIDNDHLTMVDLPPLAAKVRTELGHNVIGGQYYGVSIPSLTPVFGNGLTASEELEAAERAIPRARVIREAMWAWEPSTAILETALELPRDVRQTVVNTRRAAMKGLFTPQVQLASFIMHWGQVLVDSGVHFRSRSLVNSSSFKDLREQLLSIPLVPSMQAAVAILKASKNDKVMVVPRGALKDGVSAGTSILPAIATYMESMFEWVIETMNGASIPKEAVTYVKPRTSEPSGFSLGVVENQDYSLVIYGAWTSSAVARDKVTSMTWVSTSSQVDIYGPKNEVTTLLVAPWPSDDVPDVNDDEYRRGRIVLPGVHQPAWFVEPDALVSPLTKVKGMTPEAIIAADNTSIDWAEREQRLATQVSDEGDVKVGELVLETEGYGTMIFGIPVKFEETGRWILPTIDGGTVQAKRTSDVARAAAVMEVVEAGGGWEPISVFFDSQGKYYATYESGRKLPMMQGEVKYAIGV